jgi:hypothetical protein
MPFTATSAVTMEIEEHSDGHAVTSISIVTGMQSLWKSKSFWICALLRRIEEYIKFFNVTVVLN